MFKYIVLNKMCSISRNYKAWIIVATVSVFICLVVTYCCPLHNYNGVNKHILPRIRKIPGEFINFGSNFLQWFLQSQKDNGEDNGEETTNRCGKHDPEKKDEWWQKQWKSDNMAVYQVDNYTPWKSLYRQGENLPYTKAELEENFIDMLEEDQAYCQDTVRAGNMEDGGWHVCVSPPYMPRQQHCLVYSFGIKYDFSYDSYMVNKHNCTVRAYDPSMYKHNILKPGQSRELKKGLYFYKIGIGARSTNNTKSELIHKMKGWHIQSLGTMLRLNGDERKVIDMLKMDVEGSEWPSFEEMFQENSLSNVKQLAFEIHIESRNYNRCFNVLLQLEQLGFRRFLMNKNQDCNSCFELYYINMNFL